MKGYLITRDLRVNENFYYTIPNETLFIYDHSLEIDKTKIPPIIIMRENRKRHYEMIKRLANGNLKERDLPDDIVKELKKLNEQRRERVRLGKPAQDLEEKILKYIEQIYKEFREGDKELAQ